MNNNPVSRDERTTTIENASYRIAYLVLSYGILACVAYRAFFLMQSSWDLLALVIFGGLTTTIYQAANKAISRAMIATIIVTFLVAAALTAVIINVIK